jgi:7-carboxy-7-deazaguanine synthase
MSKLIVNEIYRTLLGESRDVGEPCVIVRLTGCHRRCRYCDSGYAFHDGAEMTVPDLLARVNELGADRVLVTGGEPLLQDASLDLMRALRATGRRVLLETSGTLGAQPLASVPEGVCRVVDVKTPGSGVAEDQVDWAGLQALGEQDELKFVCCDRDDYEWARDQVQTGDRLPAGVPVGFSPADGLLAPTDLADWILEDGLPVRFQFQLHKVLWPGRDQGI